MERGPQDVRGSYLSSHEPSERYNKAEANIAEAIRECLAVRTDKVLWAGSASVLPFRGAIIELGGMPVTISDDILTAARISEPELKRELALALFQQERLTLAQASGLAELSQRAFQRLLGERHIPVHYGTEEFEQDLRTLREMGRL